LKWILFVPVLRLSSLELVEDPAAFEPVVPDPAAAPDPVVLDPAAPDAAAPDPAAFELALAVLVIKTSISLVIILWDKVVFRSG
jgi:hypothetical protein